MKELLSKWNLLDAFLYKLEIVIDKIGESFSIEEPDVEVMIEAETVHLKEENKQLKELQYPKPVKMKDRKYYCPNMKCTSEISKVLMECYRIKFCPECGQRIFLNKSGGVTGE